MKRFRLNIALLLIGMILCTALATWLFVSGSWPQGCLILIGAATCIGGILHLQSRLIGTMSAFVSALEMNDTTFRIQAADDLELKRMADSMNRIAELYRENMRELQTRKLYYDRVLKIMTHEMRNGITPIAALSADMKTHPERYQASAYEEAVTLIYSQAEGIRRFLDAYYNLTHLPEPKLEEVSAADYFRSLKKIFRAELDSRGLAEDILSYTLPEEMTLTIDPSLMNQVMMNLLRNSLDAIPEEGGSVNIVLSISDSRPFLTVTDNGSGIPQNVMDSLFTPFFTTKTQGSGVGLAISRQIIQKHGGNIHLHSSSKGTTVTITL